MEAVSAESLKLFVNKKNQKVLFAEAPKDFVEIFSTLLSFPVRAVVDLLKEDEDSMAGSLGELCQSIEALRETYIQRNQRKSSVLNPTCPICSSGIPLLQLSDDESQPRKFYTCTVCHYPGNRCVSDVPNVRCPRCKGSMNSEMSYVSPGTASTAAGVSARRFVKGVVSYMVKDNLEVTPMSTISCITLLSKFHVKDLGSVEERVVDLGVDEVLKLLKASMSCKNVLTSVFLGNNGAET